MNLLASPITGQPVTKDNNVYHANVQKPVEWNSKTAALHLREAFEANSPAITPHPRPVRSSAPATPNPTSEAAHLGSAPRATAAEIGAAVGTT